MSHSKGADFVKFSIILFQHNYNKSTQSYNTLTVPSNSNHQTQQTLIGVSMTCTGHATHPRNGHLCRLILPVCVNSTLLRNALQFSLQLLTFRMALSL